MSCARVGARPGPGGRGLIFVYLSRQMDHYDLKLITKLAMGGKCFLDLILLSLVLIPCFFSESLHVNYYFIIIG